MCRLWLHHRSVGPIEPQGSVGQAHLAFICHYHAVLLAGPKSLAGPIRRPTSPHRDQCVRVCVLVRVSVWMTGPALLK